MEQEKVTEFIIKAYDKREFKEFYEGPSYQSALWDISQELRSQRKYGKHSRLYSKLEEKFYEILNENNVSLCD
jgi:hypothetical protein